MYNYRCSSCDATFDKLTKISERMCVENNPCPTCLAENTVKYEMSSPMIVSDVGSILSKTDNGWKEVLSKVKEKHVINNIKT
jgi:putative FmdB family regulatory protein